MRHIDAEDVLHEVAFNVFSKIDFETTIENIAAYFYRSVKNKITDIVRKPSKTVSLSSFEEAGGVNTLLEMTQNGDESVEKKLEKIELKEEIHRALQLLSPDYRNILIATEFEMKTLQELSDEWQVPLGTLLSRRHRALAKLQKILENYYVK
jgi:RNA polymerase sigma-70 factor (ECF subfamily)